jgi:hypothetical protein
MPFTLDPISHRCIAWQNYIKYNLYKPRKIISYHKEFNIKHLCECKFCIVKHFVFNRGYEDDC